MTWAQVYYNLMASGLIHFHNTNSFHIGPKRIFTEFNSLKKLQNEINARSIITHPELLQAGDGLRGVGGQQVVQQAQAGEGVGE